PARLREIVRAGEGELWVDVDSNDLHQHALLEKVFEFHTLAVEDTLSPRTRVKLEEDDRYVFVVMAGVQFDQATPDLFDLQTSNSISSSARISWSPCMPCRRRGATQPETDCCVVPTSSPGVSR